VSSASDPFQRLATILTERGIAFVRDRAHLDVKRSLPTGFDLSIHDDATEWTIVFDGGHGHFDSAERAIECFLLALTPRCRLRVVEWGGTPCSWRLEAWKEGRWALVQWTGSFLVPFWRRRVTKVFQNDFPGADGR